MSKFCRGQTPGRYQKPLINQAFKGKDWPRTNAKAPTSYFPRSFELETAITNIIWFPEVCVWWDLRFRGQPKGICFSQNRSDSHGNVDNIPGQPRARQLKVFKNPWRWHSGVLLTPRSRDWFNPKLEVLPLWSFAGFLTSPKNIPGKLTDYMKLPPDGKCVNGTLWWHCISFSVYSCLAPHFRHINQGKSVTEDKWTSTLTCVFCNIGVKLKKRIDSRYDEICLSTEHTYSSSPSLCGIQIFILSRSS